MIIAKTLEEFDAALKSLGKVGKLGLVPTMGALHEGHLTLIRRAVEECDAVVVSDFVNPTQFNNKDDFNTYPRTLDSDSSLLEPVGVKILLAPRVIDMYPEGAGIDTRVFDLGGLDQYGEGPRRPGHFNGMAQIVTRLFDIVKPDFAYFGEKDFQQLAIIEYFVENLRYPLTIVRCPIARGEDGLALSSRNALLTPEQRKSAPHIYEAISKAPSMVGKMSVAEVINAVTADINTNPMLETEYVEIIDARTMKPLTDWSQAGNIQLTCAVYARPVRLIDNIKLK
ncbi:MAG: pantoate--beta-alanine ligase [Alistipes sp.]|nr:pantoate--beta-alanine ligase [Candidatus Minthomonas equi]